ncbi:MAG: family 10 glycosylhydrolase [Tepidisphaeraceae bacterium]
MNSRRAFLKRTIGAGLAMNAVPALLAQASQPSQPSGDNRFILSAPLTHSDWMLKPTNVPWGEAGVRHMLDQCKACGWSIVHWRVCDAGCATYKSKLMRPMGKGDANSFWTPQSEEDKKLFEKYTVGLTPQKRADIERRMNALDYANFDALAAAVKYGHEIGLKIYAWLSVNEDDHGWGWASEFAKAHPAYRWVRRDGRPYHSQLSFAFPQVRQYKLAIIEELLAYDIDGLFLDWIRTGDVRDNPQNDPKGVADYGYEGPNVTGFQKEFGVDPRTIDAGDERWARFRAAPQTQFMREARKLVRAKKPNAPVAVMVGHPWHYRGHIDRIDGNLRGLLLDVTTWADEGLMDAAIAAGYYRDGGTPEMAYKALRDETGGKTDVWTYGWVVQNVGEFERDASLAQSVGAKHILYWEADYIDDRPNAAELKAAMAKRAKG